MSVKRVCLLGLGEAGSVFARDLIARGVRVSGWDPDVERRPGGVDRADGPVDAIAGADVVLSLNTQAAAVAAAASVAGALDAECLYADLNTTAAAVKREVAALVPLFADVAVLGPAPARGLETPCLVSGQGAARFAELFGGLGMPIEIVGDEPGEAATRKLVRSVFTKGVAAAVLESLDAARAAGCEPWLRAQIDDTLGAVLAERLVGGSELHAARRVDELESAAALLDELGVEPDVTAAAARILSRRVP